MSRQYLFRRLLATTVILLVGAHAWLAGREGLSNLYAHMAYLERSEDNTPVSPTNAERRQRALHNLETSLRHSPRNAWALEMLGAEQLRLAREYAQSGGLLGSLNTRSAARSANTLFHRALLERPTAPHVWANLAVSKLRLGEIDAELFQALRWADELGPWEPDVQAIVIEAGLIGWAKMEPEQRETVLQTMSRGALRDPGTIAKIVKNFNRLDLLCAINSRSRAANPKLAAEIAGLACDKGNTTTKGGS